VRPELAPLLAAVRAGAVDFATLCNRLDMAPRRVRALIDDARSAGHAVEVAHDHVGVVLPEPSAEVVDTGVAPSTGKRQQIAAFSDTQFGSKYCMREAIVDFVKHAYAQGCREVLHAGDWLDGCYKHGIFELSHSGIEDQTRDSFETLPELPGLSYHAISGNHDDTFADATGMAPGDYIEWYFRQHGRNDVHFYGRRGAYLKVRGATVELWHPKRGTSYALSYHLQNHIRDYGVGQKPDILVAGHWHINCYLEQRGVHAIAAPCFQSPGSAFSKSLGGAPSIGGLILSWELTEARTLRRFSFERSSYFMREDLRELELA
jgi:predicted phosphodiesterase